MDRGSFKGKRPGQGPSFSCSLRLVAIVLLLLFPLYVIKSYRSAIHSLDDNPWRNVRERQEVALPPRRPEGGGKENRLKYFGPQVALHKPHPDRRPPLTPMHKTNTKNPCFRKMPSSPVIQCLPYFAMIGVTKSGVIPLYQKLVDHPNVLKTSANEISRLQNEMLDHYSYAEAFPVVKDGDQITITGEVTQANFWSWDVAVENLKFLVPNVKMVVVFAHPVVGAYKLYQHMHPHKDTPKGRDWNCCTFAEVWRQSVEELEDCYAKHRSDRNGVQYCHLEGLATNNLAAKYLYADPMEQWLKAFPREQFLFLRSHDLFAQPEKVLDQVADFLGISNLPQDVRTYSRFNQPQIPVNAISPELARSMHSFYEGHNQRLYEIVGQNFGWTANLRDFCG